MEHDASFPQFDPVPRGHSKTPQIVGGIFGLLIAPILAGIAVNYIQKALDKTPDKPDPAPAAKIVAAAEPTKETPKEPTKEGTKDATKETARAEAAKDATAAPKAKPKAGGGDSSAPPKAAAKGPDSAQVALNVPAKPAVKTAKAKAGALTRLFNGTSLLGFDTYLGPPGPQKPPIGMNKDPGHVFTVRGGELHISGKPNGPNGALITEQEFENYELRLVYKWGTDDDSPKKSGVLLHCTGKPDAVQSAWHASYRCVISNDGTGILNITGGERTLTAPAAKFELKRPKRVVINYVFQPRAPLTPLDKGTVYRLGFYENTPPGGKYEPGAQYEHPPDQWNTLICTCFEDRLAIRLNGRLVNYATNLSQKKGKIAITAEGSEIVFREITIRSRARLLPLAELLKNAPAP